MGGSVKATENSQMSIMAHLKELRGHLFLVAIVFMIFSGLGYGYRDEVLAFLLAPLNGQKLSYLTPGGGFSFIFKTSMWCGIAAAVPMILFAIYRFVSPALPERAQSKSVAVLITAQILMICGFAFGYIYAIPGAIRFLLGFADQYVQSMLTADSYLDFILAYTVGLGVLFQIPLILVITNWVKPLKPLKLLSFERYVVLVAFILAAVITPTPDVVNQCVIALPIILMYQLGVIAIAVINWRDRRSRKNAVVRSRKSVKRRKFQSDQDRRGRKIHSTAAVRKKGTRTVSHALRPSAAMPSVNGAGVTVKPAVAVAAQPVRRTGPPSLDGMRAHVKPPTQHRAQTHKIPVGKPVAPMKPVVRPMVRPAGSMHIPARVIANSRTIDGVSVVHTRQAAA